MPTPTPEPKVRISFHADPSVLDRFDDLAWERRMARAELLREVMEREVRESELERLESRSAALRHIIEGEAGS